MDIDADILSNQRVKDFSLLLNILAETKYSEKNIILQVESQAYELLRERGEDVNGLIIIALAQSMLGNHQKAVAVANNIWDLGGEFNDFAKTVYINLLINLGLVEMASILLKPIFGDMENSIEKYFYMMMKFSVVTGNTNLIERLLNVVNEDNFLQDLYDFVYLYKQDAYEEHFKNIQRIVINSCKDNVCAFEYAVHTDRGFADLELFVYVDRYVNIEHLEDQIEAKINQYFTSQNITRLYNYDFTIIEIEEHPAMLS